MTDLPVDRDLLFGMVAVQMRFIDRAGLVETLKEWVEDTTRTLSQVLVDRRCLTDEESHQVTARVAAELQPDDDPGASGLSLEVADDVAILEAPGERNARRYQIVRAHAKGGLGEVYLAEDTELHRHVALKEIRAQHARNPVSRERFVAEAEITGNLEHPGVVPVYGFGSHPDGRPFYAMRFIKGDDLGTAIRRFHSGSAPSYSGLEFRWLLRKFIDVCNTVAYAHSRGVLHRDLKPTNIMIGPFGETLVMDWGVARLIGKGGAETVGGRSAAASVEPVVRAWSTVGSATMTGQALGTPSYMSPEQAGGRLDALGPASDVYSLGATLYVMLCDRRPFLGDAKEVLRMVQEGRAEPPRQVKPLVPRALDAICRRAMALEASARYASALDLAADIERWLADEPTSAWHDPWPDRARRWLRRHQTSVAGWAAAIGVALVALVFAVPLLSLAWRNELTARRDERTQRILALAKAQEAQTNLRQANEEKDRAEQALQFLVDTFRRPDPLRDGRTLKVVDFLDHAVSDLDHSFGDQPLMKATLLNAIGETFCGLGMHDESFDVFQRALGLRRENLGEKHQATLSSMNNLAMAYYDAGRFDMAIPMLETTLETRRITLGEDHADTIETGNDLAVAFWKSGQPARAIPLYETTLAKVRVALGENHGDTLTIMDNLAIAYCQTGQHDKAIALHQAAIAGFSATLGEGHLTTLIAMNNLARAYQVGRRLEDSIELYETTIRKLAVKLTDDHPTTLAARSGLAVSYRLAGKLDKSLPLLEVTLGGRRTKLGPAHPETLQTIFDLADAYAEAGQANKSMMLAREFVDKTAANRERLPAKIRTLVPRAIVLSQRVASDSTNP